MVGGLVAVLEGRSVAVGVSVGMTQVVWVGVRVG